MPARRPVRDRDRDRGQVAIEFVGTVPLILLLVAAGKYIGSAWSMSVACGASGDVYKATVTLRIPVLYPGLNFGAIDGTAGAAMERED
ncbi:hypothetical protein [Streptomyces sp. ICC1]|uniref:hypothetical protein n=1 Tax=Streptomyces sp. ICC1 TaxID=2099583 RepID=UPI000DC7D47F|nr:hypothetical protein [Streptomyces sp. ICC1]AWZ14059.1 hypothetical protein DRB96_19225 [Streptomyces sp. ICC1]